MANYNWGEIIVRENKRGRESVIFKIRKDLLEDESCVSKLTQHGVSSSDMQSALDVAFIESDDEDKYSVIITLLLSHPGSRNVYPILYVHSSMKIKIFWLISIYK